MAIPEQDLYTLRATIEVAPNAAPGLLAYLDHAVGWEIDRRAGQSYALQRPMAAIPDDEVGASLDALAVLLPVDCAGCGQPDRSLCGTCREAMELAARHCGPYLRWLPDGETGERRHEQQSKRPAAPE